MASILDKPTYRVRPFPREYQFKNVRRDIQTALGLPSHEGFRIHSLSLDLTSSGRPRTQVATVTFDTKPAKLGGDNKQQWPLEIPSALGDDEEPTNIFFDTHFEGFTPLTPSENDDNCTTDCIFIPGWGAHPLGSLLHKGENYAWLRDDIQESFRTIRAWTYGDGPKLSDMNSVSDIHNFADTLRLSLASFVGDTGISSKRFIFIVHSLGGIVFKKAVENMKKSGDNIDEEILEKTVGALFFGVPSQGLDATSFRTIVNGKPSQSILNLLDRDSGSRHLDELDKNFFRVCNFRVMQFHEQVKTPTLVKQSDGISWKKNGKPSLLVSFESATSCRTGKEKNDLVVPINKNHSDMVKFSRNDRQDQEKVYRALKQLMDSQTRFQLPKKPDKKFIGRKNVLEELVGKVLDKNVQRFAIVGPSNIGKTQLVLEFCSIMKTQHPDYSIFWVSALSDESFRQDYDKLAKLCNPAFDPSRNDTVSFLQDYLGRKSAGKWILVVDHVDNARILFDGNNMTHPKLAEHGSAGTILFTTRNKDVAYLLADSETHELGAMNPREAKQLLYDRLRSMALNQDESVELLKKLGYMPLAIDQACSYIDEENITIQEYLNRLRKVTEKLSSNKVQDPNRHGWHDSPSVLTWLVTFEKIRQDIPDAANILFCLSFLENRNIPMSILREITNKKEPIQTLVKYLLLSVNEAHNTCEMQELVHSAVKIWMEDKDITEHWEQITIAALANVFPPHDWDNRNLWKEYIPHAVHALQTTKQMSVEQASEQRASLCLKLGLCLSEDGRGRESVKWILECVSLRKYLPYYDGKRLSAEHYLGYAYTSSHRTEEAIKLLKEVVGIRKETLNEAHEDLLASQHELARAYLTDDKAQEAVPILEVVVAQRRSLLDENDPNLLKSQHALGKAWLDCDEVGEAINLLKEVVGIRERELDPDHPFLLKSQRQLGTAYLKANQVDEAIGLLAKVVEIRKGVLTEDHPNLLMAQHELARAHLVKGDHLKEAIDILEEVVRLRRKALPKGDRDTKESEELLAQAHRKAAGNDDSTASKEIASKEAASRDSVPSQGESSKAHRPKKSGMGSFFRKSSGKKG